MCWIAGCDSSPSPLPGSSHAQRRP
jgi:hypothetical protein